MAISDGIITLWRHRIRTTNTVLIFSRRCGRLRWTCKERGRPLKLATGCDFPFEPGKYRGPKERLPRRFAFIKDYLLVEFNEFPSSRDGQTIYEIQLAVYGDHQHPERNAIIRTQPERLEKWIRTVDTAR